MAEEEVIRTFGMNEVRSFPSFIETIFRLYGRKQQHCIQAIVEKYDAEAHTVDVLPLPKNIFPLQREQTEKERPLVEKIPVLFSCHGGFMVDFPLKKGDTGWIIAGDRSFSEGIKKNSAITTVDSEENEENEGPQDPDDNAFGKYSYGFFIPHSWAKMENKEEGDDGSLILRTISSEKTKVAKIRIAKDGSILIVRKSDGMESRISINEDGEAEISRHVDETGDAEAQNLSVGLAKNGEITLIADDKKIVFSKKSLSYDGTIDEEIPYVLDVRYDPSSHQIQKKTKMLYRFGTFIVGLGETGDWEMVEGGQAQALPQ